METAGKALIAECCDQHGFRLLALETDIDHVHCFVSASPRWAQATIVGLLKGYTSRGAPGTLPEARGASVTENSSGHRRTTWERQVRYRQR
ncbi:transposase [Methylacidiphilum caldifontis]|uniref:transposase n=1 Tax=Methylacidiphilum caldifontis TaxID=2795386 RepID=UPI0036F1E24B